jgi:hypothetical protein
VCASGRSRQVTSTASTSRPSAARGSGVLAKAAGVAPAPRQRRIQAAVATAMVIEALGCDLPSLQEE